MDIVTAMRTLDVTHYLGSAHISSILGTDKTFLSTAIVPAQTLKLRSSPYILSNVLCGACNSSTLNADLRL
jgi:hypothetical protein